MADIPSDPMARWRTLPDAARELNVSRRTIQRWISQGYIKAYRRPLDVRKWVDLDEVAAMRENYRPIEPKDD